MEKNPVELMKKLIQFLPKDDIKYAEKFINKRDFESLQELVNSDIYLVEKSLKSEAPNPKYIDINIEKLNELKGIIDEYCDLLFPELIDNNCEDFEEEIEEEEEW